MTKSRKKRKRETFFWLFWFFFYYSRLPQCHLRRIFLCFSFEISALDSESKPTKFKQQSGKIPKIDLNLVKIKDLHTCLFIDLCCDIFIFTVSYPNSWSRGSHLYFFCQRFDGSKPEEKLIKTIILRAFPDYLQTICLQGSRNFIRLLRVVITSSVTSESTSR